MIINQISKKVFCTLCSLTLIATLNAKITLPTILDDNMVLQQQTDVKLWGEAKEKSKVTVKTSWNENVYIVDSDEKGHWMAHVTTPVAGGPYNINIKDGKDEITLKNVMIGEVWFCSGQSNMEMPVRGFNDQPVLGSMDAIAKATADRPIRMYTTDSENGSWVRQFDKKPQTDCKGKWLENTPENVANISAIGYFFADYIESVLHVPVGIIVSTRGGSKVEPWISQDVLSTFPEVDLSILKNKDEITNATATPCVLYNSKIAPLTNFVIKGFLWYQGESNRGDTDLYSRLMPAFVQDMRNRWGIGNFPFYFVQIAPFNYDGVERTSAASLREVQVQNMKDISNSGMVTTLDIGDPVMIHPTDKKTVGVRLAYWALGTTYNRLKHGYAPPLYKSMEVNGSEISVSFDNIEHGLCPINVEVGGFEIAGIDKKFYQAKAIVKGGKVIVKSDSVENPVAVRYAYKNYATASVFNSYGIPASPFRTDDWK